MRILRLFAPALLLLSAAGLAQADRVAVLGLRPTQMQIGKRAADFHVEQWRKEAKQHGVSLAQYAKDVLRPKFEKTELPVVIDPSGNYRNTDGHHRITALRKLSGLTGVSFEIDAKVLHDYRGDSFAKYAEHFTGKLGKGQFTPAIERLPAVERMKHLPATYAQLGDSPMRTALEVVFTRNQIKGSWMRDYVEFRVAERLLDRGLLAELRAEKIIGAGTKALPAKLATDERVLAVVQKMLGKEKMRDMLLEEANDKNDRQALAQRLDTL